MAKLRFTMYAEFASLFLFGRLFLFIYISTVVVLTFVFLYIFLSFSTLLMNRTKLMCGH
jgi:hypothetical protein